MISSEASYLKSLNLLVDHFLKAFSVDLFDPILDKTQFLALFSNIREIVSVSERYVGKYLNLFSLSFCAVFVGVCLWVYFKLWSFFCVQLFKRSKDTPATIFIG